MSRIVRGVSKNSRFVLMDSKDIVQKSLDIHKCSSTSIAALGRLLTATVMMGTTLKNEDILTVRTATNGPLKSMLVTMDGKGVKGYLSDPTVDVPPKKNGEPDVNSLLGDGTFYVVKDLGLKEPYSGISTFYNGDIAYSIAYYYTTSEQIPTVIALGVDLENETTVRSAGGYMIQLLPNAEEEFITKLEEKVGAIRGITELFRGGMDLERILHLLYEDMEDETGKKLIEEYEILETKEIEFVCDCNKEKFHSKIMMVGKDQIDEILKEDGKMEVVCNFCNKKYTFLKEDL